MHKKRTIPVALAVISAFLALLLALLTNLTSGYIADTLKPHALWVFVTLMVVFLISLIVLILQLRAEPPIEPSSPIVKQQATNGGRIDNSPIQTSNVSGIEVTQSAKDKGVIKDSGISIT